MRRTLAAVALGFLLGASFLPASLLAQVVVSPGGGGSIISGSTVITGGTDTQVCFNDGGFLSCGDAGLVYNKTTDTLTAVILNGFTSVTSPLGIFSTDGTATAANAVSAQETAGCITFEGSASDAFQGRLCGPTWTVADATLNLPNVQTTTTLAALSISQTFSGTNTFSTASYLFGGVEAVTTTKTTTALEAGEIYTNTGDTDGATITLLNDPTAGVYWRFAVTAAQTLTIVANTGETLKHGSSTCGTSLTSNTVGSTIEIWVVVGGSGGSFYTMGATGTWTCNA